MFGRRGLRDQLPVFQPQYTVGDFGHDRVVGDDDAGAMRFSSVAPFMEMGKGRRRLVISVV